MRQVTLCALAIAAFAACRETEQPTAPRPSFLFTSSSLVVNSLADPGTDGVCDAAECTLREAIAAANADPDPSEISFSVTGTITLAGTSGQLSIGQALTITGPSVPGIVIQRSSADAVAFRIFEIPSGVTATLANLAIRGGRASGPEPANFGGGIFNAGTLLLTNTSVVANSAQTAGGGITNFGSLTLDQSRVADNTAANSGGIYNLGTLRLEYSTVAGNSSPSVGGIDNQGTSWISHSTISGNSSEFTDGGGIFTSGTLTLTNTTVSGNSTGDDGGGISNFGQLTITNGTISANSAGFEGGGIRTQGTGLILVNTLVALNTAAFTADDTDGPDIKLAAGTVAASFSLIGNAGGNGVANGVNGNVAGVNPLVGPLQNNGGSTETHALLAGSPAIDAGNSAMPPCPTTDQIGTARPQDGGCDIGAFEFVSTLFPSFSGFLPPVQSPPGLNTAKAGQTVKVKFSLGGNRGLSILASNSPASQPIDCATKIPLAPELVTLPPSGSGLTYDGTTDRYSYGWKTERAWGDPASCRQLVLRLSDGTTYRAYFRFTK